MLCCQRWWITEATEVIVQRLWRISPGSETQTRAWVDAKRTCCGRCEARILSARSFSLTLLDALTHRALPISSVMKKREFADDFQAWEVCVGEISLRHTYSFFIGTSVLCNTSCFSILAARDVLVQGPLLSYLHVVSDITGFESR